MEITRCQSLSFAKLPKPLLNLNHNDSFCPSTATVVAHNSVNVWGFNCLPRKLQYSINSRQLRNYGAIHASGAAESSSASVVEKWVLEPIGDGDTRHIGFKTGMPNSFEIPSNAVTVGRTPERVDVVILVPTVSGVHARIEKTEDRLLITDLDSTNGTFIDEKRLRPGVVASALPGSKITFGDTHLAIFRVSKLSVVEAVMEPETEAKLEQEANNST